MITMCPGCRQPINRNSATMLHGGLVYHQQCAPGSIRPFMAPGDAINAAGRLLGLAGGLVVGFAVLAAAIAWWPVTLAVLLLVALVKFAAREFAKAIQRS